MRTFYRSLISMLRRIPFLDKLFACSMQDYGNAFLEFVCTTFFSFTPLLVAYLVTYLSNHNTRMWPCIMNNIKNGELFLYSASFLAPVFFTVMRKRRDFNVFPSKAIHMFFYGILFCIVVLVFGLKRSQFQFDHVSLDALQNYVFCTTLILFYLVLVLNNSLLPNPAETMRLEEKTFTSDLRAHRR